MTILEKNGYSSYADYWQSVKKQREKVTTTPTNKKQSDHKSDHAKKDR
jgi:hypothetical protein